MKKKNLLPLNLQFFAEEGDNSGASDDNANKNTGNESGGQNDQTDSGEKTFTQSQVSAMMAKEKNEGRKAMLKSLGFESEKEAKDAYALLNALKDSQNGAEEKAQDKDKAAKELSEANARASAAESKLACLENGVNKESLEDVLAIASSKVSDDKDLNTVLKEMSKSSKYALFFTTSSSGTGSTPGHTGSSSEELGDYGKKLAEKSKSATSGEQKSSFFD